MNKVTINGKTYTAPDGCSISVINSKAYVDGQPIEDFKKFKEKKIEITIEGNCKEVKCNSGIINVNGNVEGNVTSDTGNIKVQGDVRGNVECDCGNISAHHIFGNASTDVGNINGIKNSIVSGRSIVNSSNGNTTYTIRTNKRNWFKEIFENLFD